MISKEVLKKTVPTFVKKFYLKNRYGFFGPYKDWLEAKKHSGNYSESSILEKIKESALKAKGGEIAFERDGVLFRNKEFNWPLLASLLLATNKNDGSLNILDFGGSLASVYFQHQDFLRQLKQVNWGIVEQPDFVKIGQKYFANDRINFYENIEECFVQKHPRVILFSSSLQYMEDPYSLLRKIIVKEPEYLILDRTSFTTEPEDFISVQKVPPSIYKVSYPCWFLNENKFLNYIGNSYELLAEWSSPEREVSQHGIIGHFKGFLFKKKHA